MNDELIRKWQNLERQFEAGSAKWPNVESLLILWPEGDEPPELPPCKDGHVAHVGGGAYRVNQDGERYRIGDMYHATVATGSVGDSPGKRWRHGKAGKLILRRDYDRLENVRQPDDENVGFGNRFKLLSELASDLLEKNNAGLSEGTMRGWHYTRWSLAIHEIDPLRNHGHIKDAFLASAFTAVEIAKRLDDRHDEYENCYSKAKPPKMWARDFGMSVDTFKSHCKSGKIRHKRLSDRMYQIHVDDIPKS